MRKLLIGPALLGATCLGGSLYGSDARQVVHKNPEVVYAAVARAIDTGERRGTMQIESVKVPYEVEVDRVPDERLVVRLMMNGRQGGEGQIGFAPENGGKDTLMTLKVHTDHKVIGEAFAGTSKAKLAFAPDWLLNLAAKTLLQQVAEQIEQGALVANPAQAYLSQADWEASLPPEKQREVQEWRQYEASKPMVDPSADAKRYLEGNSN